MNKKDYRPQIDGLRALAVLSVILYHAKFNILGLDLFQGGFIGVDIFFVISGYLITKIILLELIKKNKFNFLNFYARRILRILPMLIFIICVTLSYGILALDPTRLLELSESALSALSFISNFYFYFSTTEYGASSSLLKPLLHTCSLGVEEQFYIIAPIIFLLIWKFKKNFILITFIFMFLMSLQFAEMMTSKNPQLNFYLPFSRFWELLVGSIIACIHTRFSININKEFCNILTLIGLFFIVNFILSSENTNLHPSFNTFLPVLGAGLIIFVSEKNYFFGRLMSFKPFVGLGLISYSAYLWHYPIFAFSRIGNQPNNYDKFEYVILTLILSVITYFSIEKMFRYYIHKKTALWMIFVFFLISAIGSFYIISKKGFLFNYTKIYQELFDDQSYNLRSEKNFDICMNRKINDPCVFGNKNSNIQFFLVGDSVASSLGTAIKEKIKENNFGLTAYIRAACYYFPNSNHYQLNPSYPCDEKYQNSRVKILKENKKSIIIISGMLDRYINQSNAIISTNQNSAINNFESSIRDLLSLGHKIIFIYPSPIPRVKINKQIFEEISKSSVKEVLTDINKAINRESEISLSEFIDVSKGSFNLLDSFKSKNILRIFPHDKFCNYNTNKCSFAKKTEVILLDDTHFSSAASKEIAEELFNKMSQKGWFKNN